MSLREFLLALIFALSPLTSQVRADESIVPQQIRSGDALSADFFNDLLGRLSNVTEGFSSGSDLVGTWACTTYSITIGNCMAGFSATPGGLLLQKTQDVTFSCTGSICQWNSQSFYPLSCETVPASWNSGSYEIRGAFITITSGGGQLITQISKHTATRFTLGNGGRSEFVECKKKNLPPISPTGLIASAAKPSVVLSWEDRSSDETGFKVSRKYGDEDWSVIATVGTDITSYTDTPAEVGSYLYRVTSTGSNGDSLGSNVVVAVIE